MSTKVATREVEITIDDVRRFMGEEQPAEIAKKYFNTELPVDPDLALRNEQKNLAKIADVERNLAMRDDKTRREEIINQLISQKHSGALSLKREEEELQQLQQLETRLRDESMKLEDERRAVNAQLKQSKKEEVELIERQVQQDMFVLEEQRVRIEKELAKKQENIGSLRDSLHEIETEMEEAYNKRSDDINSAKNAHENTADERKKQFQELHDEHTRRVAENKAYSYSIGQEKRLLDSGDYKVFNNLVVNDSLQKNRGQSPSSLIKSQQDTSSIASSAPAAVIDPNVANLLTEYGLKKQGEKVAQMKADAIARSGNGTVKGQPDPDFDLGSDFEDASSKIADRIRLLKEGKSVPTEAEIAAAATKDNKLAPYNKAIGKVLKSDGTVEAMNRDPSGGSSGGVVGSSSKFGNLFNRRRLSKSREGIASVVAADKSSFDNNNAGSRGTSSKTGAPLNMVSQLDMWLDDGLKNPLSTEVVTKSTRQEQQKSQSQQPAVKDSDSRALELQKKGESLSSANNNPNNRQGGLPTTMEEMQAEILRLRKLKFRRLGGDDSSSGGERQSGQDMGRGRGRDQEQDQELLSQDRRSGRRSNMSYSAAKVQDPFEWQERDRDRDRDRGGYRRSARDLDRRRGGGGDNSNSEGEGEGDDQWIRRNYKGRRREERDRNRDKGKGKGSGRRQQYPDDDAEVEADRSDMDEYLNRRRNDRDRVRDRESAGARVRLRGSSPIRQNAYQPSQPPQLIHPQQPQPSWLSPYSQQAQQQLWQQQTPYGQPYSQQSQQQPWQQQNPYGVGYNPYPYGGGGQQQDPYGYGGYGYGGGMNAQQQQMPVQPYAPDPYAQQQQQQQLMQPMQQNDFVDVRASRDNGSNNGNGNGRNNGNNIAPKATRKLADDPSPDLGMARGGQGNGDGPPARLTRAEQKHQQELQALQFELEMIKKKHEVSDFKAQLEKQRQMKMNEVEHEHWLQQQQNELEQIKMKQAIAKEQKILNMQLAADKAAAAALEPPAPVPLKIDAKPPTSPKPVKAKSALDLLKHEAGVVGAFGDSLIPASDIKGVLVYVDGVIIPKSVVALGTIPVPGTLAGDVHNEVAFRLAIGVYDSKGKLLSRLGGSDWQTLEALDSDGGSGEVLCSLHVGVKKIVKKLSSDPDIIKRETKALVELQTKAVPKGTTGGALSSFSQNTLGWAVVPLFNYLPQDGSLHLGNGFWRAPLRKGAADGNIDPASVADGGLANAWALFRVCDYADAVHANEWQLSTAIKQPENSALLSTTYHALQVYNEVYGGATSNKQEQIPLLRTETPVAARPPSTTNRRASMQRPPSNNIIRPPTGASTAGKPPSSRSLARPSSQAEIRPTTQQSANGQQQAATPTTKAPMSFNMAGRLVKGLSRPASQVESEPIKEEEKNDDSSTDEDDDVAMDTVKNKMGWIAGTPTGPATVKYERGDGVDIYIDAARFLPDCCTATRCVLKLFSRDNEQIGETAEQYADPSSQASHPIFAFKTELRSSTSLDVTMTALVRLDTVDYLTLETLVTGYTVFKVFCTRTRTQPVAINQADVYVNTGAFQLPLKGSRPSRPKDGVDETMLDSLPRIPCATLLVRILPAPKSEGGMSVLCREDVPKEEWAKTGLDVAAPPYNSGAYDGKAAEPQDGVENVSYLSKLHNAAQNIDGAVGSAITLAGTQVTRKVSAGSQSPRSTAAAFPVRPTNMALNDPRMISWIEKLFQPSNSVWSTIDYSYAVPYSADSGISISIDGLNNMPDISGFFSSTTNVYKVIYSICPPGMFYMNPPITNANVQFTRGNDLKCPVRSGRFTDGFSNFFPQLNGQGENHESLWLILDVRTVRVEAPKGKDVDPVLTIEPLTTMLGSGNTNSKTMKSYWTILPLFKERAHGQGFKYVATGVYTLPLLEGAVPTELITSLTDPYDDVLQKLEGRSLTLTGTGGVTTKEEGNNEKNNMKLRINTDGSTILVRVTNPQVTQLEPELSSNVVDTYEKHLNTRYVTEMLAAYRKNTAKDKGTVNEPLFSWDNSSSISNKSLEEMWTKYDAKKVIKEINKLFGKATSISY